MAGLSFFTLSYQLLRTELHELVSGTHDALALCQGMLYVHV